MPDSLLQLAHSFGFPLAGIVPAENARTFPAFEQWLAAGMNGELAYMCENAEARRNPASVLPGVQSLIMLGMPFEEVERTAREEFADRPVMELLRRFPADFPVDALPDGWGWVAEYAASGIDYHDLIRRRIKAFQKGLKAHFPNQVSRGIVDTAPLLEREFAQTAGLGFVGRNRMLIHPEFGSFIFLAAILTTEKLPFFPLLTSEEKARLRNGCETCGRCQRNCPTGALTDEGVDARRCVSALTIETRGPFPTELLPLIGNHALGCDECQRVCPWNRKILKTRERTAIDLRSVPEMTDEEFRRVFAHTPFWRATLEGLKRFGTRSEG